MSPEHLTMLPATSEHLTQIMAWFPTEHACRVWGGWEFRFPFTDETFMQDCRIGRLPTFVLLDESGAVCAFGQCSSRSGRCHLGRLATRPADRGGGIGTQLIRSLAARGTADLKVSECSLFVLPSNPRAKALYERLGFRTVPYPDRDFDASAYDYMIVAASKLIAGG
jgi:ribosomal protein S18 acetylase RimI-like enzyme